MSPSIVLAAPWEWIDELGWQVLLGLSRDTSTAWLLQSPLEPGGPVDAWRSLRTPELAVLARIGVGNGESTSFATPQTRHPLPAGTVDFLALAGGRFLGASTVFGLYLIAPLEP